ncbi:MAG TPA: HEAT repeat domain-containing protein [Prosthecobacter sp.]|nr:HEAT repeat domain-containing protein [Prosthecobacter sp.]HRK14866.1 HEAT repeat domain-containing protein [Prosthecobacter sp.]
MKTWIFIVGGCLLAAVVFWSFQAAGPDEAQAASPPVPETKSLPPGASGGANPGNPVAPSPNTPAPATVPMDAANEVILQEIEQASITYDAKDLPRIRPFLSHPDPEIREAAINGMIVLGDAAAAPMLREASQIAPTPQEAVRMQEVAAYLELPSGSLVSRTKDGRAVLGNPNRMPPQVKERYPGDYRKKSARPPQQPNAAETPASPATKE